LLAVSDLHVGHAENRDIVCSLEPDHDRDWLILAGDVAETAAGFEWALGELTRRFARVIWVPGNHELWTSKRDPVQLRGAARYEYLVGRCQALGVVTPEDPYPVWASPDGPVTIAPMFLLYDYSFRPDGAATREEGLEIARNSGVICTDEYRLHPDPYASRHEWCHARVAATRTRLAGLNGAATVLVNHWPLVREPTRVLRYPQFAQWCGTELTADWHTAFNAAVVVYGHLHIPRTTRYDGVRFEEVSVGYPREWKRQKQRQPPRPGWLRTVLPGTGMPGS
jgi:3',5'-cyclic AMP phosphodiesterase CpdA